MALETVLVSRSVTFDPSVQAEVLKDLERFSALGFSVYRQVGEIVTIPEARGDEPEPEPRREARLAEATAAIRDIREKHGLSYHGIGALIGCSGGTVANWQRKSTEGISTALHGRLMDLWRKSGRIAKGSTQLRDLAKGASAGVRLRERVVGKSRRRAENLTDDKRLEIATLREGGKTLRETAELAGVSKTTVMRVCKELSK
jgi:transcriptional regulator with XRE-family HTH domain